MQNRLDEALQLQPWYVRQVFKEVVPLMRRNSPFGFLPLEMHQIAQVIGAPDQTVYNAFGMLKKAGLVRHCRIGYFSPLVLAELTFRIKRKKRHGPETAQNVSSLFSQGEAPGH